MGEQRSMCTRLVLASGSPRRQALLRELGVPFETVVSGVPECPRTQEEPSDFVRRAAREKAYAVAALRPEDWVLGADTEVVLDSQVLGKPADVTDAGRMLRRLSGKVHRVLTGVALLAPGGRLHTELAVESRVEFRTLGGQEVDAYVASGEPMDKAGAYAIQGGAAGFVRSVSGSYTNVVGLPLEEVRAVLSRNDLLCQPGERADDGKPGRE